MFIVKHNGKELYFLKRHRVSNFVDGMLFTESRSEAKRYVTNEDAQRDIDYMQDEEYIVVEE